MRIDELIERTNARLIDTPRGVRLALSNASRADTIAVKRNKAMVIRFLKSVVTDMPSQFSKPNSVIRPIPRPIAQPAIESAPKPKPVTPTKLTPDQCEIIGEWLLDYHWVADVGEPLVAAPKHIAEFLVPMLPRGEKMEVERTGKMRWNRWADACVKLNSREEKASA